MKKEKFREDEAFCLVFTPEEVDDGLLNDLLQFILTYNKKSKSSFIDSHITTDGYCTIVECIKAAYDYRDEFGRFVYIGPDEIEDYYYFCEMLEGKEHEEEEFTEDEVKTFKTIGCNECECNHNCSYCDVEDCKKFEEPDFNEMMEDVKETTESLKTYPKEDEEQKEEEKYFDLEKFLNRVTTDDDTIEVEKVEEEDDIFKEVFKRVNDGED